MMTLYSGTTCPFSQRCRIVLYEKGMDFQIHDVDLFNKPEDLAVMNPYNRTPVLVERDLILYESNIINEYIDDRFPHPQLMPADPVMRARARLFLFRFENEQSLEAQGDRLFAVPPDADPIQVDRPRLVQGAVEGANVNTVSEMVRLTEEQRFFQIAVRFAEAENERKTNAVDRLLRRR